MARAGLLTYILLQMWQHLAFSAVRALWVCLCRDRLELVAKCLPHSSHLNLVSWPGRALDLPSNCWMDSGVNDLMVGTSGSEMSEQVDSLEEEDRSERTELDGDTGGGEDVERSRGVSLARLRSSKAEEASMSAMLKLV